MKFDIGTVLSITHGKLLTSMENVYKILNFMLSDSLFTHQLPRASRFARGFIVAQHPQLEQWGGYDEQITTENWRAFLGEAEKMFGAELEIEAINPALWAQKDPLEELAEMVPVEKIVTVNIENIPPNN